VITTILACGGGVALAWLIARLASQ
jgi:hypothetical protein